MPEALIDSHCHLDFADFDADRAQVINNSRAKGVKGFVIPGTTAQRWPGLLALCGQYQGLWPALGLHPYYCALHQPAHLWRLEQLLEQQTVVAIGEIGLDFALKNTDKTAQQRWFEAQLKLARKLDLPVILHVRKAHQAVLESLQRLPVQGGICHAFNGSPELARQYAKQGFVFGFGGMLTYPHSRKLRALAAALPLHQLVLETDSPDMSGFLHRGQRNSPEYLPEVLDTLAEIRQESREEIRTATTANCLAVLHIASLQQGTSD